MENTTQENKSIQDETKANYVSLKFKKPKPLVIATGVAVVLIIVALFFAKGFFVAATVNGSPVSRWSVIKQLEKEGGKQALESIIDKKLIEAELTKQKITVTQEEVDGVQQAIDSQYPTEPMIDATEPVTDVTLPPSTDMGLEGADIQKTMETVIEKILRNYFTQHSI